jgi:hypothetical protein
MHPRTDAALAQLRQVEWFDFVGVRDTEAAIVLASWPEAIESSGSLEWENLCQEAVNQYCARLKERSPADYRRWNEVVLSLKPATQALVRDKTAEVIDLIRLPKSFIDQVDWDILHVCMESEFADVYPPGFYASQAYWYIKGHFPCGWHGPFPHGGKLVIY